MRSPEELQQERIDEIQKEKHLRKEIELLTAELEGKKRLMCKAYDAIEAQRAKIEDLETRLKLSNDYVESLVTMMNK